MQNEAALFVSQQPLEIRQLIYRFYKLKILKQKQEICKQFRSVILPDLQAKTVQILKITSLPYYGDSKDWHYKRRIKHAQSDYSIIKIDGKWLLTLCDEAESRRRALTYK